MASKKIKKLGFGTISLALLTALIAACAPPQTQETEPQAEQPATEQPDDPGAVTREDVSEDYDELIGQTVTIRGDIDERLADNVVRMSAGNLFAGQDIIVVLPDNFVLPTEEDGEDVAVNRIQVTGQVQRFTAAEAQQYNVPEDEFAEDEDRPMILADTAALSPDPGELSDNPERFYNQTVAVEGGLEEIGPNAYRLSGGLLGSDILVISDQPLQQWVEQGDELVITGEARQFDIAEFQQQYNWDADLQQQITDNYGDSPVIVAQEVFPIEE